MSNKKKNKKIEKVNRYSSDSEEAYKMIKVLAGVVVVLVVFYLVFAIATGEISFGKKETKSVEIQNVEILAGTTFSRSDEEYYVLMYDFAAADSIVYSNLYSMYSSYYGESKIYLVDLSKKFNSQYIAENESQVKVTDINSLKVVNGTLVKVSNGVGVSYSIGEEKIKNTLFNK